MKRWLEALTGLYGAMLRLYPRRFRDEFGAEMRLVFARRALEASGEGRFRLLQTALQEIKDFPGSLIGEHWRAGRELMSNSQIPVEKPASLWALLSIAVFFMVPSAISYLPTPHSPFMRFISSALPVLVIGMLGATIYFGIKSGLPRWSLVFVGVILGGIGVYGLTIFFGLFVGLLVRRWVDFIYPEQNLFTGILLNGFNHFIFWLGIAIAVLGFVDILRRTTRGKKAGERILRDWTQLSFLFYGALLIIFFIDFDEYQHEGWYVIGCLATLTAGAWAYLRIAHPTWRVLALLAGVTVSMAIMGVGKYYLVPLQDWPIFSATHTPEDERWFESLRTIATWFWTCIAVGLPGLLQAQRKRTQSPQEPGADWVTE